MKTLTTLTAAAAAIALVAGCGGSKEGVTNSPETTPAETQRQQPPPAPEASAGEAPTYEDVKKLALADSGVKDRCSGEDEDRDIGQSPEGETYKRMFCGGAPIFDYVTGKQVYEENYQSSVDLSTDPLWHLEGQAYVKVESAAMSNDFAKKVEGLCDCGEVVQGGYGK